MSGSFTKDLTEAESAARPDTRFVDLALALRDRKQATPVLLAGGRWDRLERRYTAEQPETARVFDLQASQLPFVHFFADWLEAYKHGQPRDVAVVLLHGARRGGKTVAGIAAVLSAAISVPDSIAWLIAKTFSEVNELDRWAKDILPEAFYSYRGAPYPRFTLANGSQILVESAQDPERLRKGRCDFALINEGQKIPGSAFLNVLGGSIDTGGIVVVAANPPTSVAGQYLRDLKDAIASQSVDGGVAFRIDPAQNDQISSTARRTFTDFARIVDPRAAEADGDGAWVAIKDAAYPNFDFLRNVGPAPSDGDITSRFTERRLGMGRAYRVISGTDFQRTPYHAAVLYKVFGTIERPVYWAIGEILAVGTEDDLLDRFGSFEHDELAPETLLTIGDASGSFQDGAHTRGRASFDIFRQRRFHILPPGGGTSEGRLHPRNPAVQDRLSRVNALLQQGRFMIDPGRCPSLINALKSCRLRSQKPAGEHAHITDAAGYALFWMEPRLPSQQGMDTETYDALRAIQVFGSGTF